MSCGYVMANPQETVFSPDGSMELIYDLRQRYANIVGNLMEDITQAMVDSNYSSWFKALDNLYTTVEFKFKKEKDKDEYKTLKNNTIQVANKYFGAWTKVSTDSNEIAAIEESLRNMQRFLYRKMDEAKMFGAKRNEGLL